MIPTFSLAGVLSARHQRRTEMRLILGFFVASFTPAALACYAPPASINRDHAALVSEATAITVVEAVSAAAPPGCSLRVIRTLKGVSKHDSFMNCRLPASGDWMTSFSAHSENEFWQHRAGRLGVNGDCTVIVPAFEVGRTYLVFDALADTKQFEQIDGSDDKWLRFVENRLQDTPPKQGLESVPVK